MNVFTNVVTGIFYLFTRYCAKHFRSSPDPSTGEILTEKNKKFELRKVVELPWVFWMVMLFSLFETSTAVVFTANATELAELRFGTDAITTLVKTFMQTAIQKTHEKSPVFCARVVSVW